MLEQLLVNLVRNAIEASQDIERGERRLDINASVEESDGAPSHVVVSVADNGPGIAEAHIAELFNPFFSTKAEGMGMGLSICRSVVEFHGGRIEHRVRVGGGAVFRFVLPLAVDEVSDVMLGKPREEVSV